MKIGTRTSRPVLLAMLTSALWAAPALAGPPWISVEYPVNPFDPATRSALMVVHTYHHGHPMQFPVRVVAVGTVDGQRRRAELPVVRTSRTGVWAVTGTLPRGEWVLSATLTNENNDQATLLAGLGTDGRLVRAQVPFELRDGLVVPRPATQAEVEAMLASVRAAAPAPVVGDRGGGAAPLLAGFGLLALAPLAVWRTRRARSRWT